ncbi:MAG: DUF1822 family protein [Okeania sp. SIO2C9]|uniref:DUF1822 family protein n=1 Tax=Okeania sp. SIO2C9 TaxID=2607791 RepID=UPI0013BF5102|nr:DUF1822 family protein [Okeania sp. SIO2C9]NEQ71883.1 DUF1822 family protein [Okeania sp. SIO2C9]
MKKNRPRSVRANYQGIEQLKQAQKDRRAKNEGRLSYPKIAEQIYVEETTVKRFFRGEKVFTENAELICETLGLKLAEVVDLEDYHQNGTQITLSGEIDEVKPQLDEILELLRKTSGDKTITIRIIKPGSVIIIIDGSNEGLTRIESLFQAGELKEIAGFKVEDVRPEWEERPVNLTQWFDNILTTGWQAANELLTPSQLALVRSAEIKGGKLIYLRADMLSHAVVLLVNLVREDDDSPELEITLRVYPTGDNVYLPPNLKLIVLSENEVFKEVVARSEDRIIQCRFTGEIGEEFTVKLVLGEAVISEDFVI